MRKRVNYLFCFIVILILEILSSCQKCYECTKNDECTRLDVSSYNGATFEYDSKTICSEDYGYILSYQTDVAIAYSQFQSAYPGHNIYKTVFPDTKYQEVCGTKTDNENEIDDLKNQGYSCEPK